MTIETFAEMFPAPLWGEKHTPLVHGWAEKQLNPVVARLRPHLPRQMTPTTRRAIASCALSIMTEYVRSESKTRYSRAKNHYAVDRRYRSASPYDSWFYTTTAMDMLQAAGLIQHEMGQWLGSHRHNRRQGRQSIAWPTPLLFDLLWDIVTAEKVKKQKRKLVPVRERQALDPEETIILRDAETKAALPYEDTPDTHRMRAEMTRINEAIAQTTILRDGQPWILAPAKRIFTGDFDHGGRIYFTGMSHQNIPKEDRAKLQIAVDGIPQDTTEVDYTSIHMVMAYAQAGRTVPPGDLYTIGNYDRTMVKVATNIILNAPTRSSAAKAVTILLRETRQRAAETRTMMLIPAKAKDLIAEIEAKHRPIKWAFASGCGLRFQKTDSDLMVEIILRVHKRTTRAPLPVHDSCIVAKEDAPTLFKVMEEVAAEAAIPLAIKGENETREAPRRAQTFDRQEKGTPLKRIRPETKKHTAARRKAEAAAPTRGTRTRHGTLPPTHTTQPTPTGGKPLDLQKQASQSEGRDPPEPDG